MTSRYSGGGWSFVHIDDAAAATVAAIEPGQAGSIYNSVDDAPAQVCTWLPALAAWLARLVAGEHLVVLRTQAGAGCEREGQT